MKTKLILFCLLVPFFNELKAQTVTLTSATPTLVSSGSSLHLGVNSGNSTSSSSISADNCFVGRNTGNANIPSSSSGNSNSFFGNNSGYNNTSGGSNLFSGFMSGFNNTTGNRNVYLGLQSGFSNINGSDNVFIGIQSGFGELGSNKLYIDNTGTTTPLIWGDFTQDQLKLNGKVGIGSVTTFPDTAGSVNVSNYRLFVTGGILTEEVRVTLTSSWADYVFNKDYNLKPLSEVEKFISENGHLPNVPSAKQVKEEGIELGNMSKIQQEKIEELTLYVIEQNKINQSQAKEIEELKAQMKLLINRK